MRLARRLLCIGVVLGLAGCAAGQDEFYTPQPYTPYAAGTPQPLGATPPAGAPALRVALLAPMSGPNAARGPGFAQAAQLALSAPGSPVLDVLDTGGTPEGAAAAVQKAVADGDGLIIGPFTAGETAAATPGAQAAGLPMLPFTSDPARAKPGIWPLGLTPGQQVRRLVQAAQGEGRSRFAALLPDNDFGHIMGNALTEAATADGAAPPTERFYDGGMAGLADAVKELSDYADRRGPVAAQSPDSKSVQQARALTPPPFDALLLAATGVPLSEIATLLPYYDVATPKDVRVLGPALWASPQSRGGAAAVTNGAWFAAPDPAARTGFDAAWAAKFGGSPPPLSDLAYDAASIARVVAAQGGGGGKQALLRSLTRPDGFSGADGVFALLPDGHVRRALAVFEIHGTSSVVQPAPTTVAAIGS